MAYEANSGQSDSTKKNRDAAPGSDDHTTTSVQEKEGDQQADALEDDSETNPDTLTKK